MLANGLCFIGDKSALDLTHISEFIGRDSPKYASITISKIRNLAKQLLHHPYSGRKVPEVNQNDLREIIFGNYRIIYKIISESRIDIKTVAKLLEKIISSFFRSLLNFSVFLVRFKGNIGQFFIFF